MAKMQKMMVTSALPYGNGPLHLGHMVEHIMTDVWVRTQRLLGHQVLSICGDDAHGTPIMLKAKELGLTPLELTQMIQAGHEACLKDYSIHYDVYHSTHSNENLHLVEDIYAKLQARGDILVETISQAYDTKAKMFLPDRYIKGTCPKCLAEDQYGDNCEKCGATYNTNDVINPRSTLTNSTPEYRDSEHYFFNLPRHSEFLQQWAASGHIPQAMQHKLQEWFESGLKPWDVSRDAPYFGFLIPGTVEKYFYVWLDAPIGYIAACQKYCMQHNLSLETFWGADSPWELYHVVGKDIMYFHALFWPALLKSAALRLPNAIFTHGFLTINGQKMSKSRGTFIQADDFTKHFPTDCLRYYLSVKMNGGIEDIDLSPEDFIQRINADLIGKVVNIASRSAKFIHQFFADHLSKSLADEKLYLSWKAHACDIILAYQQRDNAKALRQVMLLADKVNQYVDAEKPWVMAKDPSQLDRVQAVCTMALNGFRLLILFLQPVLPKIASEALKFLRDTTATWQNLNPLLDAQIEPYEPLLNRLNLAQWEALLEDMSKSST